MILNSLLRPVQLVDTCYYSAEIKSGFVFDSFEPLTQIYGLLPSYSFG